METGKKYKLTDECIIIGNRQLYRIEALKNFGDVHKGDKGGFIESEVNLSHNGDCWVFGNAAVCDNAYIYGNAKVYDNANIYGNCLVFGNANVFGDASVCDNARVFGDASVYGDAEICNNAEVCGNANVSGNAVVYGNASVCVDARVVNNADYIVFKNWWSSGRYFTWTRSNNMWRVGCFYGTSAELIAKAYKDSELSGKEYERVVKYVESILKDSKL